MHKRSALSVFFLLKHFSKRLSWVMVAFDTQDLRKLPPPKCQFSFIIINNKNFFDRFELITLTSRCCKKRQKQLAGYRSVRGPHFGAALGPVLALVRPWAWSLSLIWKINSNISKTVQDSLTVSIKFKQFLHFALPYASS